ncbi:hypothetical protein L228DRAFT_247953 [Xylona heveae TC161]|uniref:Formamidopyrimidine-DNA glycosylase catalytic domain-containing protein n=1 Tax=Xylona heveae (strain CBS 132557 / TC161) TaxID=1328760 RepID=A0A165GK99_XYLHT|nr:hypothetical protein L228DRAFT_247953 [Xylona heveae TC161]KZF22293.1 hypothetical protein L228DRAFT_247953 [Xylona heveae TC161]
MPEIGEVARIVSYLRKYLVGRTISAVKAQDDPIVFGKVGTSASEFKDAITGKKVIDAGQQGKYFWLTMSSPPHICMHFGMSGWIKFSNDDTSYYKPTKPEENEWPPKYWKFILQLKEDPDCEVAFIDARRLGRVRLIDCDAANIRKSTPLKENGPDPVIDKDILTLEWLTKKMRSKRVPVKALLLDQANISGVGNWVGDEILYHAKIHPEQYSNTFSDAQLKQLHTSLLHICSVAVETGAESGKFPEDWLMKHRWGKGKKDKDRLPNGEKIVFLKVGGRTSAVVPSVQKKTGPVAGDVTGNSSSGQQSPKEEEESASEEEKKTSKAAKASKATASKKREATVKKESDNAKTKRKGPVKEEEENDEDQTKAKKAKTSAAKGPKEEAPGRRRSARVSGRGN